LSSLKHSGTTVPACDDIRGFQLHLHHLGILWATQVNSAWLFLWHRQNVYERNLGSKQVRHSMH